MYNLAILTDIKKEKMIMPAGSQLKLVYSSSEDQVLNQLVDVDGVLVHSSTLEKSTRIYEFMLAVNRNKQLPVWVKSETESEGKENNRVLLELGALGYLDAKISDEENFVLIENTLRLIYQSDQEESSEKSILLNPTNRTLQIGDKDHIQLTKKEYKLVKYLSSEMNQGFTYKEIYQEVWGEKSDVTKKMKRYKIANTVFHIRTKLKGYGYSTEVLRTVRSVGYMLDIKEC